MRLAWELAVSLSYWGPLLSAAVSATENGDKLVAIATYVLGGATLILAAVAAFQDTIKRFFYHSKLSIDVPKLPFIIRQTTEDGRTTERHLVLLRVENQGNDVAEKSEIYVQTVTHIGARNKSATESIVPKSLRWHDAEDAHLERFETISPGMQRYCTLGALKKKGPGEGDKVYFQLWTTSKISETSDILWPGEYEIQVYIGAANASSRTQTITLRFEHTKIEVKVSPPLERDFLAWLLPGSPKGLELG